MSTSFICDRIFIGTILDMPCITLKNYEPVLIKKLLCSILKAALIRWEKHEYVESCWFHAHLAKHWSRVISASSLVCKLLSHRTYYLVITQNIFETNLKEPIHDIIMLISKPHSHPL